MHAANSYVIRLATDADAEALSHLAILDAKPPLEGPVLVGELHGEPVAAVALRDERSLVDPYQPTEHVLICLRQRKRGLHALERMPSLRERLIAGLPATYRVRAGRAA
jgi:hypothetical protein